MGGLSLNEWVSSTLLGGGPINPETVSRFIGNEIIKSPCSAVLSLDLTSIISSLSETELVLLLMIDVVENKKYSKIDNLTKQQKMFLAQARKGFACLFIDQISSVLTCLPFELKCDIYDLWEESGCLHIYE